MIDLAIILKDKVMLGLTIMYALVVIGVGFYMHKKYEKANSNYKILVLLLSVLSFVFIVLFSTRIAVLGDKRVYLVLLIIYGIQVSLLHLASKYSDHVNQNKTLAGTMTGLSYVLLIVAFLVIHPITLNKQEIAQDTPPPTDNPTTQQVERADGVGGLEEVPQEVLNEPITSDGTVSCEADKSKFYIDCYGVYGDYVNVAYKDNAIVTHYNAIRKDLSMSKVLSNDSSRKSTFLNDLAYNATVTGEPEHIVSFITDLKAQVDIEKAQYDTAIKELELDADKLNQQITSDTSKLGLSELPIEDILPVDSSLVMLDYISTVLPLTDTSVVSPKLKQWIEGKAGGY